MNKLCGSWYRDKDGKEIDASQLENLLRDNDYRIVLADKIGPYYISTVWLGVPHGVREPFDYFETMVFLTPEWAIDSREHLGQTLDCDRYHCFEEAVMGHYQMIEEWKNKTPEDLWKGNKHYEVDQ